MTISNARLVAVGGPTASGKSLLVMALAELIPIEIINFDSMQVYRGMDIGTAKPGGGDLKAVPHHLLDLNDPDETFSVGRYTPLFRATIKEIVGRGRLPVAVGGTGLYLRGALGGLFEGPKRDDDLRDELKDLEAETPGILYRQLEEKDPETASKITRNDMVRIIRALEVFELSGASISSLQREHSFRDRPYDAVIYCLNPPIPLLTSDNERIHGSCCKLTGSVFRAAEIRVIINLHDVCNGITIHRGYGVPF